MDFSPSEPDDSTLENWALGTVEERELVLTVAWKRHHEQLPRILKNRFSSLSQQDCEDIADDAFCFLWRKLIVGEFAWKGPNTMFNFLLRVSMHDATDLVRKRNRRAGLELEIRELEEGRAIDPPDLWLQKMEYEALKKSRFGFIAERLIACAQAMKRAQRSVGVIMADCWVSNGRWPTNERILERLREQEPELKLGTVVERRKEVLSKFRAIKDIICDME